jgi:hypothetical protein
VKRYALPAIVLLGLIVRVPFWVEALRTPVDGDTAIIGLMARHPLSSTTMWGQPYGSPVEAWLASPILAAFGFTPPALRLVYFLLGLALIPAVAWLAAALDPRAMIPAALLMACPSPYFLLLAALPPPLYPTVLLLTALLLGLTVRIGAALDDAREVAPARLLAWGALGGLALWTHWMAAAVVLPAAVYLLRRSRAPRVWVPALAALAVTAAPLAWRVVSAPDALRIVSVSGRTEGTLDHLRAVVPELHRPLIGVLGAHVPWIADDPDHVVYAPTGVSFALVAAYGALLIAAISAGPRGAPGLLLAVIVCTLLAFPFPVRSSPATLRFLTPLYVPLAVLVCWGAVVKGNARRGVIVALTLASLNLTVATRLLQVWRAADRADAPFLSPDLRPLRRELEARGVRHVYASYVPAYRLAFESGERIVASQPWNERFLHHPLPYLDEVRFARRVAWVLMPRAPGDLPAPETFERRLGAAGGRWERLDLGPVVVYHGFVPPFGPTVAPLASAGEAGDGRLETARAGHDDRSVTWAVDPPRALAAVTLVAPLRGPRLPRGMDLEVSADGATFERVVRRRRREERDDLRWVNGHPQFVVDDDLVATPLGGRTVAAVRLTPVGPDPWAVGEVLVREAAGARESSLLWDEWLDPGLDWPTRQRVLARSPRLDREDWYYRRLLAERHR